MKGENKSRGGALRTVLTVVLAAVFILSVAGYFFTQKSAEAQRQYYTDMAQTYTKPAAQSSAPGAPEDGGAAAGDGAPITVDFASLRAVNEDIEGWLYCEGTPINYPVVRGETDDTYLRHNYEGRYSVAGSIFAESRNSAGFADANTILYGHNMADGSMFASLQNWQTQEFYEAHPEMWLLTPEATYRVVLFSAYQTSAYSSAYSIFTGPCPEFDAYLAAAAEQSAFRTDFVPDGTARCLLLSTCASAYGSDEARCVLHGAIFEVPA